METQKVDSRIRVTIENCITSNHRSIFIILGDKALKNVFTLYQIVKRKSLHRNLIKGKFSLLWCSDNSENIRIAELHNYEDCDVIHCTPSETECIQHKKFPFVVVDDLKENIRPLHLMNIINSCNGRGILIFLFSKINQVEKLTCPKDSDFRSRFMKRLCATFEASCCVILDDRLNILPQPQKESLLYNKDKVFVYNGYLQDVQQITLNDGIVKDDKHERLKEKCVTMDQTKFFKQCLETLEKRCMYSIVSASSPARRGKSAVLGLAIAAAIDMGYSNIYVSSLSFGNVTMVFKYLLEGLTALNYEENLHYDIIEYDHPLLNAAVLGLNIFKDNAQAVRFAHPGDDGSEWERAELVVIDEAAAIPLPLIKRLIGPYTVLMASTIEGYGASGKFLYEDMVNKIHQSPSSSSSSENKVSLISLFPTSETNTLVRIELNEPVDYASDDGVECWMNHALCLNNCVPNLTCGAPPLEDCRLFYVCRETLFSYQSHAENFLQQLISLFSCSKRIICPDDLLTIADNEDYHIFCLLPPLGKSRKQSFEILCAILVQKVKYLPSSIIHYGLDGSKSLPDYFNNWTSLHEPEQDFLPMQGIWVVEIVTHPTYRHTDFNYDFRALELLQEFYSGKSIPLDDNPFLYSTKNENNIEGTKDSLPLLLQLTEVEPEKQEFILVSFFLTPQLLKFWKKSGFVPMYISTEKNSAEEHLCIVMKGFESDEILNYMRANRSSFLIYFSKFLYSHFKYFQSLLALELLISNFNKVMPKEVPTKEVIDIFIKPQGMKSLEKYCRNLGDFNSIVPYIGILSERYFRNHLHGVDLSVIQQAVLLSFGLQQKTAKEISKDTRLTPTQVNAKLNQVIIIIHKYLNNIIEKEVEKTIPVRDVKMVPVAKSLEEELDEAALKIKEKQAENLQKLKDMDFSEFAIKGTEDDWEKALHTGRKTLVSIKSLRKPFESTEIEKKTEFHPKGKKSWKRKK